MDLAFKRIDVRQHFALCYQFRCDAYQCSFDSLEGCDQMLVGYQERLLERIDDPCYYYLHIWLDGKIIGQLEFKNFYDSANTGYVNLIYLSEPYRGCGLAEQLQKYIEWQLTEAGCRCALLSVSRTNARALRHYQRFGWRYLKANPKHSSTDFYQRLFS
ncbi:GNAT family N-acetyltransferase [Celerinatantimonas yamalensis]|uniref:GNAT family N-acetyltransferase n=1 Tax=Celerinatantimonas yamalensis TaxID=559956 RepID=A0ABW9G9K4_9GAMM